MEIIASVTANSVPFISNNPFFVHVFPRKYKALISTKRPFWEKK
jgi:hypothetical protein